MATPQPTKEQLEATVEKWNHEHPIGTRVRRYAMMNPRSDPTGDTTTRSLAWIMGDHLPVVLINGYTGAQHLDQLKVLVDDPASRSHIPAAESLPPPAKPKRSGAFFASDVADAVDALLVAADEHGNDDLFITAAISQLQAARTRRLNKKG